MLRMEIFYFMIFICLCYVLVAMHRLSLVVACRLRYPTACGISVPQARIKPAFPVLESGLLTIEPPGKSQMVIFLKRQAARASCQSIEAPLLQISGRSVRSPPSKHAAQTPIQFLATHLFLSVWPLTSCIPSGLHFLLCEMGECTNARWFGRVS